MKKYVPHQDPLRRDITDRPLPEPAPGGHYRYGIPEEFKEGGGGILTKVTDPYLGREVIVKTLRPEFNENADVQLRFLREARVTALLEHPSTIPIYEMGRDSEGNPYFTMKEIKGVSLRRILSGIAAHDREFDRFRSRESLIDICIQVGQALAYAHASGVVHRDIKPGNIMVGAFGEVMVIDWGVAKILDGEEEQHDPKPAPSLMHSLEDIDTTEYGKVYGTPRYMAPEQARGHVDLDARVDVFSLGAVLYECLTHRPLVFGANREELLKKICEEPFVAPAKKEPYRMIPPELDALVMKSLEKDPKDRYSSMEAFVDDMQRFRRGQEVSVMHITARAKIQRWAKRKLDPALTPLLLLVGFLVGYILHSLGS